MTLDTAEIQRRFANLEATDRAHDRDIKDMRDLTKALYEGQVKISSSVDQLVAGATKINLTLTELSKTETSKAGFYKVLSTVLSAAAIIIGSWAASKMGVDPKLIQQYLPVPTVEAPK